MGCKINALLINPRDNVVVVMEALQVGDMAIYKLDDLVQQTATITNVPAYHKLARSDIHEGEGVVKYGEMIGQASSDIRVGQHVHTHNVISVRENISEHRKGIAPCNF